MAEDTIPRRDFLRGAAIGTAAALTTVAPAAAQAVVPVPSSTSTADEPQPWLAGEQANDVAQVLE